MIVNVHPVADVHSVPVQLERLVMECCVHQIGNEFLHMLTGAVIVAGSGDDDVLGMTPHCAEAEQVGRGFGSGIGSGRIQGADFHEAPGRRDRAVDLIG